MLLKYILTETCQQVPFQRSFDGRRQKLDGHFQRSGRADVQVEQQVGGVIPLPDSVNVPHHCLLVVEISQVERDDHIGKKPMRRNLHRWLQI